MPPRHSISTEDFPPSFPDEPVFAEAPVFAEVPVVRTAENSRYAVFGGIYMLIRTVGQGEFGKVKLAVNVNTSKQVAVKLTKTELLTADRRQRLMREISILQSLDHPYILKLYDVIETPQYIGMIMEPCLGGELFEYIVRRNYLPESDAVRFFAQIITGVSYLHNLGIVHRDLKLENILLDADQNIILADFGFASPAIRNDSNMLETSCGSPAYAAPELVLSDKYSGVAADIWSCGVILFAMLAGYLPYDDDPANPDGQNIHLLYKYIMAARPEYPEYVSVEAQDLIGMMLVTDPTGRAKMVDVMGHAWMGPAVNIFEQELERRKRVLEAQAKEEAAAAAASAATVVVVAATVAVVESSPEPMAIEQPEAQLVTDIAASNADEEHVPEVPRTVTTPVSTHVKFMDPPAEPTIPLPPATDNDEPTSTISIVLTPPTSPLVTFAPTTTRASKSEEQMVTPLSPTDSNTSSTSKLGMLFKRSIKPITRANSDRMRDSATPTSHTPSTRRSFSLLSRHMSNRSSATATPSLIPPPQAPRMSLSGDIASISASDYHLRHTASPPTRRLKFHPRGAGVDKRALSTRPVDALFADLEHALVDAGMEVLARGEATGEFRLQCVRRGVVEWGRGGGGGSRGVVVEEEELRKVGIAQVGTSVAVESGVAKALRRGVKEREKGEKGGLFPVWWVSRKWQYFRAFGVKYNMGYDGKAVIDVNENRVDESAGEGTAAGGETKVARFVDEVNFEVEIFKLKNLQDVYVVEFKRVRGDIWEFKSLYHKLIAELPLTREY
ncbi:hypothetical protein HDU98_000897 [Podochytrium sp. JEL0797]|nr:hypothetical protein HDU98_000897 [Podochytrium sp. JEL0797]